MDDNGAQTLAVIGARLKARRLALGLTQDELAERLGHLNVVSVSMYERGQREPRLLTFLRIANALGMSPGELLPGRTDNPSVDPLLEVVAGELRELADRLDGSGDR